MPEVPDVLKGLDIVPLCQMAQECTYGAIFVCDDGSVFLPSCDVLLAVGVIKVCAVLLDCHYSLDNTVF